MTNRKEAFSFDAISEASESLLPTTPLYLTDSYLKEFDAKVVAVRNQGLILDSTAFYPGGGGQPPDRGTLRLGGSNVPVLEMRKEGEQILHVIGEKPPVGGSAVHGVVDWSLRYAHMRHHTALHILSAIVYHQYGSLVTGGQIYHDRARLDFDLDDLGPERVTKIADEANKVVQEAHEVSVRLLSRDEAANIESFLRTKINLIPATVGQIRIVEIEGLDAQADGGTHVRNTREVGTIRVVKTQNKGKLNRRIEIALGSTETTLP